MTPAPFAHLDFAPAEVVATPLAGGGMLLKSPQSLAAHPPTLGHLLRQHARSAPDRVYLAERAPDGSWRKLTYAQTAAAVESIAQALLDRGLSADRPVVILSDNSVDHALLALASMQAGIPVVPISAAYSLMSRDFARLRYIVELMRPGLIYAADGARFAPALEAVRPPGCEVVVSVHPEAVQGSSTLFSALLATTSGPEVERAFGQVGPETVAKILFTSGSTGTPKGVINTQRMLCSNQQAIAQVWPFLALRPPVVVDWLPWSHTFGGNHNFNMILRHGGTLYIDHGKPAPGLIDATIANLREISPTLYFNVPRGYDMLLPALEQDEALRTGFFRDLDLIFYAAAALPQHLWERLEKVSIQARGERVVMVSAWGTTETSPMSTTVHFQIEKAGVIGLPAPGTTLKLAPVGDKLELRVKGPNITPGYWQREDLTRAAFDAEGFYCSGDAVRLDDPGQPARGVVFDGRIAEDFKLMSGTWVNVGNLRVKAIAACDPVVQDAVVTGHGREDIGLLVFPNLAGCRALCPDIDLQVPLEVLTGRPEVQERLKAGLEAYNAAHPGNSTRIGRLVLMLEPPSIDAGEITDKGYINQRAVLERRAAFVERLYAGQGGDVLVVG